MKYTKFSAAIIIASIIFILNFTPINAQPVTNIPVTVAEGTPAAPSVTGGQNPSVTLGKRPPGTGQNKKRTKQEIISNISQHSKDMQTKASNILSVLDAIWARVLTRIDKFKAAGKDVSGLAGWIQQVEFKRKAASDAIASGSATMGQIPTPATAKNKAKTFVSNFRNSKKALKEYHQAILTVIRNLKGMSKNTGVGPSVIPSVTKAPTATPSGSISVSPTVNPPTATVTIGPT